MAKFLRFIGFMVLALALWQTVSDTFANKAASGGNVVSENTIAVHEQTDAYIAMPQLPYLPDAELAGMGGQLHSLTYSRIQRISTTEYIFSLKDWIDKLAQRAAVLSLHREKLYDATAYYRCQPVCEYYIFTLRRILIAPPPPTGLRCRRASPAGKLKSLCPTRPRRAPSPSPPHRIRDIPLAL